MKKGKAAEALSEKFRDRLPDSILRSIEKSGTGKLAVTQEELGNAMESSRAAGIAKFILVDLYSSAKDELGIEIGGIAVPFDIQAENECAQFGGRTGSLSRHYTQKRYRERKEKGRK